MERYQAGGWSVGLFGCFNDVSLCILGFFCPCVIHGQTAESIGAGDCVPCGATLFVPVMDVYALIYVRGAIRERKGIDGTVLNDVLASLFCPWCVVVQNAQELKEGLGPCAQSMSRE